MADTDTTLSVGIVLTLKKLLEGLGTAKDETTKAVKGIAAEAKLAPQVDTEAASKNLKNFGETTSEFLKGLSEKLTVTPKVDPEPLKQTEGYLQGLGTKLRDLQGLQSKAFSLEEAKHYQSQINAVEKEISKANSELKSVGAEHTPNVSWIDKIKQHLMGVEREAHGAKGAVAGAAGEEGGGGIMGSLKDIMGGGLGAAMGIGAGAMALEKLFETGKAVAERDEELTVGLRQMGLTGEQAAAQLEKVKEASDQTSDSMAVGHVEVENLTAAYLKMGGTTANLAQKQEIIIALAKRAGVGNEQAAKMYAKAADDESGSLGRLGIVFEKNATQAQKQATIAKALTGTIAGMKEAADGPIGSFEKLQDAGSKLMEGLGSLVFSALSPAIKFLGILGSAISAIVSSPFVQWIFKVLESINPLILVINLLVAAWNFIHPAIVKVQQAFDELKPSFVTVGHMFSELWTSLKGIGEALFGAVKQLFGFGQGASSSAGFMEKLGSAIKTVADAISITLNGIKGAVAVVNLIVTTLSTALSNFDIFHPGKLLKAFDGFGEKAKAAFNEGFNRVDSADSGNGDSIKGPKKVAAPKAPKAAKADNAETTAQEIDNLIKLNETKEKLGKQSGEVTKKNLQGELAIIQKGYDADEQALKKKYAKQPKALAKHLDDLFLQRSAGELKLTQAIENVDKRRANLRSKAGLDELAELDQHLASINKKYKERADALAQLVKDGAMSKADAAQKTVSDQEELHSELAAATTKFYSDEYKKQVAAAKLEFDFASSKTEALRNVLAKDHYAALESSARAWAKTELDLLSKSNLSEAEKALEREGIYKQMNDTILKSQQDRIKHTQEMKDLDVEVSDSSDTQKSTEKLQNKFDAENALLDAQHDYQLKTEAHTADERAAIEDEYRKRQLVLSKEFEADRAKLVKEGVTLQAQIEKSLLKTVDGLQSQALKSLKVSLGLAHAEKEKITKADLDLATAEHDKSLSTLADQVRKGTISYQDYIAQKEKKDQDLADKQQQFADEHQSVIEKAAKAELATVMDLSEKLLAQKISDAVTSAMIDQSKAETGAIAWLFSTLGPIAGAIASGLAILAVQEIFSAIMPKGKREGGYTGDYPEDQIVDVVHGREHVLNAGQTRKLGGPDNIDRMLSHPDPAKAFEQHLLSRMSPERGAHFQQLMRYPTVPPLAKSLQNYGSSSGMSHEDRAAMRDFTKTMKKVAREGVTTNVKTDFQLRGKDIHGSLRSYGKSVSQRANVIGGGMK